MTALEGLDGAGRSSISAPSHARFCCSEGTTRRSDSSCVLSDSRYFRSTWLCGRRRLGLGFSSTMAWGESSDSLLTAFESGVVLVEKRRPDDSLVDMALSDRFLLYDLISTTPSSGITSWASLRRLLVVGVGRASSLANRKGAHPPPQFDGLGGGPS